MSADLPEIDWYGAEASTFGDRLAAARERMGLPRAELARRLGVKAATVQAWEDDIAEPRANRLQMAAGLMNVSLGWLLTGEGEGVEPPSDETIDPEDVETVLAEMRQIRAEMLRFANRVSVLEKRLRQAARELG
ncbi:helix-turn-helix transcriptional regulator [Poseidonocella sp. HB161398]|uniref:helix-turn-helix domain-containing protein n=1 Tax=Poseidonocella sp. HB161398 TaxID=2320855 RepID=UPI001109B318|nr:helix-turn-helix transcriptional regulator [Poseidonocella sp. HB161398]